MEEIMRRLEKAFAALSTIPVMGDSVEVMAHVKAELRWCYDAMEKRKGGKPDGRQKNQ